MIYRPEEEIMAELEPYKEYIVTGDEEKLELARNGGVENGVKKEEDAGPAAIENAAAAAGQMKDEEGGPSAVAVAAAVASVPSNGDVGEAMDAS